jgi:glycine betaine catabolism B
MKSIVRTFDNFSNQLTMYKGVLYGLLSLIIAADILAFFDVIGISPVGLIISVVVLGAACYVSNYGFSKLFHAATNSESWLITALILSCILTPHVSWSFVVLAALCGAIAMASKYVFTWHQSHIFNPAAFGAFVVSVTGLLSASWWIATPWLAPFTAGLALLVLRKQRKFTVFFVFAITALVVMLFMSAGNGISTYDVLKSAILSWPLIFLGSIMLTEPTTLPSDKYYQLIIAAVVGALFCIQMHVGAVSSAPHTVLLVGNLLAAVLAAPFGAWLRVKQVQRLAPDILELTFEKPQRMSFKAGQYMEWTLPHKNADIRGDRRTFSIASAPLESEVKLAVRTPEQGSSFKKALAALHEGDRIRVANISGQFTLPNKNQKLLFIAGGIGITPFRSMVAQLSAKQLDCDIVLLYFARTRQEHVFSDVLTEAKSIGVQTYYLVDPLDDDALKQLVPDIDERLAYISGPPGMVDSFRIRLRKLGVKRSAIRTDHFSGY